jgi:ribosomal protein S27AE
MEKGDKMVKDGIRKTIKYICPNKCGNSRMLNRNVNLALCEKCNYIQMVPERWQQIKSPKPVSKSMKKIPFICSKCGKGSEEGIHVLALVNNKKDAVCYE